jgi:hypothetical protein
MSDDIYPHETLSFNNLPKQSPLIHLCYGGILTTISDIVKNLRNKKRRQRLKLLNRRLKEGNMLAVYKEILEDAKLLKNYDPDYWICKKKIDKSNFFNYIIDHNISLKYLEDVYSKQCIGYPVFHMGDVIKIKKGCAENYDDFYGFVLEEYNHNNFNMTDSIYYYKINKDFSAYEDYLKKYIVNIWQCEVINSDTENNTYLFNKKLNEACREKYNSNTEKYDHVKLRHFPGSPLYNYYKTANRDKSSASIGTYTNLSKQNNDKDNNYCVIS